VTRVGRSSITIDIETWVRRNLSNERVKVTEGTYTYVAIGDDRRPRRVPRDGEIIEV
jgi:acyl-CoA thioesterase YciA